MSILPDILVNPNNPLFNLEENEVYSIKEANELIELEKYEYCIFSLWTTIIINLKRRIEFFGIENLSLLLQEDENYDIDEISLKKRWKNIKEKNILDYALNLTIINHTTHDLLSTLYWMKLDIRKDKNSFEKDEILSFFYLIEKNLFRKPFKIDKRENKNSSNLNNLNRRKDDLENSKLILSNTHQELILKSKINPFDNKSSIKESELIEKYI